MRIIIAFLLATIVGLALTAPARAASPYNIDPAEWFLIDEDKKTGDMYARKADLRNGRPESRAAKLWVLMHFSDGSRIRMLLSVDCVAETYRDIQGIAHKPNGELDTEWTGDRKVQFISPNTNLSAATEILCAPPSTNAGNSNADSSYSGYVS